MSDLQGRAKEVFLKALNQTGDRESFLENACGGDEALQQRVRALLKAHQEAGEFLPPSNLDATIDTGNGLPPADVEGTIDSRGHRPVESPRTHTATEPQSSSQIGPYKLLEEIGEGGMGTVWVAQQSEPIKRKVALKLIKAGMDSQQVLARFEAERQALAMMDHPNIARVVDAGMTEQGRPFFAMEYVKGVPLTEFCDHAKLSVNERLELFLPICNAVQHAHQKGIIHRDLKPSNILICLYDGKPVPKVIDFGLAKAMHQSLTDRTLHTHHGMMIGTPLYMSPEQAESNNLDIDTRTDIYSLGVILYELLTGGTPLEKDQLKEAVFLEVLRLIKEVEPPKPSLRLSGSESLPSVAAQRSVDPAQLSRSVTGDLDWVVMKALEKERGRRYETANGLAEDIRRHLADEPVSASPPSSRYRMQKFVKRNKGPVLAASLLLVSLLAGIAGTTWGLLEANRQAWQKDVALEAETAARKEAERQTNLAIEAQEKEADANAKAQQRAEQLEISNEIITGIFADLDMSRLKNAEIPVEAVLAKRLVQAAEQLNGDLLSDPLELAVQQRRLGQALGSLGYREEAAVLFEKSLTIFTETLGPEHHDTLLCALDLANSQSAIGLYEKARQLLEETLRIRRAKFGNYPETLVVMNWLGSTYGDTGDLKKGIGLCEEAFGILRAEFGDDHPQTISCMSNLAVLYGNAQEYDKAVPLLERVLELEKAEWGDGHYFTIGTRTNLANAYDLSGQLEKGQKLAEETLKLSRINQGNDHPDTLEALETTGVFHYRLRNLEKSIPLFEELLKTRERIKGRRHESTYMTIMNLGTNYLEANRLDEALPLLEEAYTASKTYSSLRPFAAGALMDGYTKNGQTDKALELAEEVLAITRDFYGEDNPKNLSQMNQVATMYSAAGQFDKSIPLFKELLKTREKEGGRQHESTLTTIMNLGTNYLDANRVDEALPLLEEAYKASKSHPSLVWSAASALIEGYTKNGQTDRALKLADEVLALQALELGEDDPKSLKCMNEVATMYWGAGQFDKAIPLLEKTVRRWDKKEKELGTKHPDAPYAMANLGVNYKKVGRLAEALPVSERAYEDGKTDPKLYWVALVLLEGYQEAGQFDKLVELAKEQLAMAREAVPPDSPELAGELAQFGSIYLEAKAFAEAEAAFRECLAICEKVLADSWLTFNTQSMLGGALLGQKKYEEAEPLLLKGYQGMKEREQSMPGPALIRLTDALERLVRLHQATDNEEQSAKWQAELDKRQLDKTPAEQEPGNQ